MNIELNLICRVIQSPTILIEQRMGKAWIKASKSLVWVQLNFIPEDSIVVLKLFSHTQIPIYTFRIQPVKELEHFHLAIFLELLPNIS